VTKVGGKSLSYEVDFLVADKLVALGKSTSVCCEHTPTGLRGVTIPASIREKLSADLA
jgi:acyl-CoA thioesterase FadM